MSQPYDATDFGYGSFSIPPASPTRVGFVRRLSGRILLAEDGPDNQLLIASILRQRGASVVVAANGRIAIDFVTAATKAGVPYDLILMDMQMPEIDGLAATAHLRSKCYRGAIVALTANAMTGTRETCLKAGCDDYMTKPLQVGAFLNLVVKYLPKSNFLPGSPSGTFELPLSVADQAVLTSQFASDPEMADVLVKFLERLRARGVQELGGAVEAMDRDVLKRLAHQLKGAGTGYGFPAISAAAAELETALERGASQLELTELGEALRSLCERAARGQVS